MKLQGLAVIAMIIIVPMSIILASYSQSQIKTLDLQVKYDSKLQNATYDAIKAFQLNMSNSSTSDLANSKMRDINASVNTFYNSLASNFSMTGYEKDVLQNYVPAIVYTLYDGYYIYSAYDNTLDENDTFDGDATYQKGETIYGLKPYIYYSCRYKPEGSDSDFTITYSLDSYITIQGTINGQPVNKSGYLLSGVSEKTAGVYKYKGVEIIKEYNSKEGLKQYVYVPDETASSVRDKEIVVDSNVVGSIKRYTCKKINGVKYYKDEDSVFAIINDKKYIQNNVTIGATNQNGIKYYKDANEFKEYVLGCDVLKDLKTSDAVDMNGEYYKNYANQEDNPYAIDRYIFQELDNNWNSSEICIEDSNSQFNAHRIEVIKNSIESNLISAISNYNKVSTSGVNFQMPKLQDYEWEEITQNISMITFLQGLSIGGKVYNGYAIVRNDINEDFVSEDSIYILDTNTSEPTYYKVTDLNLLNSAKYDISNFTGVLNTDFERRTSTATYNEISKTIYYYPRPDMASYGSIINSNNGSTASTNVQKYLKSAGYNKDIPIYKIAQIYYTALGRERYGMYRVTNFYEDVQEDLREEGS